MPYQAVRNRVAAGLFLVAAMVAAVVILVMVGGREGLFGDIRTVHIEFASAPNVKPGSPVNLVGQPVGRVTGIELKAEPWQLGGDGEARQGTRYVVDVTATVPGTYVLYRNARVVVQQSLVGQSAVINIADPGTVDAGVIGDGDFLQGNQQSPFAAAAAELGIGEAQRLDLQEILAHVRSISEQLDNEAPELIARVKGLATTADGAIRKMEAVLDENRQDIRLMLADARTFANKANETADQINGILKESREPLKEALAHAGSFAKKADTDGGAILADGKALIKKVGEQLPPALEKADQTMANAREAMANLKGITADTRDVVVMNKPGLDTTLQNFRATSEHLKALAKEVRRAPWRLLARPDKKEVESLNLYDTARAFASAAADLDSFSDALQATVAAREQGLEVDQEFIDGLMERLKETFQKYEEAEAQLLEEMHRVQE